MPFQAKISEAKKRQMIRDYVEKKGSTGELGPKYGLSQARASQIIKEAGVSRTRSEAALVKSRGWRVLHKFTSGDTRMVTIPKLYLTKIGVNPKKPLKGKWHIESKRLVLEVKEGKP